MVGKESKASLSDANKQKKSKGTSAAVMVLTPLLVLMLCLSLITLVSYKKFVAVQAYAAYAFNENAHLKNPSADNKYRNADALPMKEIAEVAVPQPEPEAEPVVEKHEIIYPYYGDKYAEITISNENVGVKKQPVYWGDSDDLLAAGVVQSNYSAYIGATGRVVLAAHNHTFFRWLPNILIGDKVTLKTEYGKFVYEVTETTVLPDTDTSLIFYDVTADPPIDDLVLYTCWNNGYMGLSDERFYVICKVVSKEFYN